MSEGSNSRSSPEQYFCGFDLLYKTIEQNVNKKMDVVIALMHFVLIRHMQFRCVGVEEDQAAAEEDTGSELLPDNWNALLNKYNLRYMHDNKHYVFLANKSEELFIINLLNSQNQKVSNMAVDPEEWVKATKGSITKMVPQAAVLVDRFRKELLNPVFAGTSTSVTTQTMENPRADPLRISDPILPRGQFVPGGFEPRPFGLPQVGRGDLDPLGRGGPGNLFPFPSHPDFRGAGAPRFDPFGPIDPNVRPNPNPDHLQPPNFGGDHFYM